MSEVAVDLVRLARLLREDGIAVDGPMTAERVGLGQSNLTYVARDEGGHRWIVRRPPRGHLLASAHDVLREHRILAALAPTDVPVPLVLAKFVDEELADTPAVVMEHVDGLVVDRPEVADAITPALRGAISRSLATTLAEVHRVDVDAVGLGDLSSRAPYAARQLKRWSRQWEASRTRDLPRLDALTERLRELMPEQHEVRLVHGDFHLRNVVVDPGSGLGAGAGTVRAVLDWELSTLGDPMADVGSLLAYWPQASDGPTLRFDASTRPGFATRDELAAAYLEASGRPRDDLDYWHALGLWKVAVIAEGVRRRVLDDPSNAADGGPPPAEAVDGLVERAWAVLEGGNRE